MKYIFLLLISIFFTIFSQNEQPGQGKQIPIGNFALPISQQPSPLFAFGQNIINKDDALGYDTFLKIQGKCTKKLLLNQYYFLYGLNDNTVLLAGFTLPVISREGCLTTSGFGDTLFQLEYAYLNKGGPTFLTQGTIVASVYLPSGVFEPSLQGAGLPPHQPFTGFGATSFFLGTTINHTTIDWYAFGSIGEIITTRAKCKSKIGNTLFYQAGAGYNLKYLKDKIIMLMVEMDGIYSQKDKLLGATDANSGANIIYVGPVLFYSTPNWIFQTGIIFPVSQRFSGNQEKNSYYFSISLAYTFRHGEE
jgi:hypothetical protein